MGLFDKLFKPNPPSQDRFAQLVRDGIRQVGENGKITYDPKQFCLFIEGEDGHRLFLSNIYAEYCNIPKAEREATLKRIIRTWFAAGKDNRSGGTSRYGKGLLRSYIVKQSVSR